jgi:hypothetical protein
MGSPGYGESISGGNLRSCRWREFRNQTCATSSRVRCDDIPSPSAWGWRDKLRCVTNSLCTRRSLPRRGISHGHDQRQTLWENASFCSQRQQTPRISNADLFFNPLCCGAYGNHGQKGNVGRNSQIPVSAWISDRDRADSRFDTV